MNYVVWGIAGIVGIYVLDKILSSTNQSNASNTPTLQPVPTYVATGNNSADSADSASISNSPSISSAVDSSTVSNLSAQDNAILGLNNLTSNLLINNQIQAGVNSSLAANLSTLQSEQAQQSNLIQLGIGSSSLLQSGLTAPAGSDTASATYTPNSSGGFSTVVNYATSNLQSLYDSAQSTIQNLTSSNQNLSSQVSNDNNVIQQGTATINNLQSTISNGSQQINDLNSQLSSLQASLSDSNSNIVGLKGKIDALNNLGATAAHAVASINPSLGVTIQNQFNNLNG